MKDDGNNEIRFNFSNNPALKEVFSRKGAGDKCKFEIAMTIKNVTSEDAVGNLDKVTYDEEDIEPEADKPMAIEAKAPPMPMPKEGMMKGGMMDGYEEAA